MKKLLLAICGLVVMCGCGGGGGGGGSEPPAAIPIVVSISPATQTNIDQGQTVKFTATLANDTSGKGVTWSASGTGVTGAACGTFSGTTATATTFNAPSPISANLSITVTATSASDTTKSSSAVVMVYPPPSITAGALINATPNVNYRASLEATGGVGTLTWSVASGTLPTGLTLSNSGTITGIPTVSGTFSFAVQVVDSSAAAGGPASAQAQLSLTVVTVVNISTKALPAGSEGVAYLATIVASGGTPPYTWSLAAGSLPPGLAMQPTAGVISGTPTSPGTFTFTVAAQDSSPTPQTQTQSLTVVVGAPLAITTTTLTNATPNTNYSATLQSTGGVGALTWTLASGALPTGLTLSNSGTITGDPTVSGTFTFTVQVTDSSAAAGGPASAQAQLSLTVVTVVNISTKALPAGSEGAAYLANINASGGTPPYIWSLAAGTLPPGLALQPSSGVISGTPTSPGTFTFTVAAQDSSPTPQTQTQSLTIIIGTPPPLTVTTTTLTNATPNSNYSATLQSTGGVGALTWTLASGALPTGLSLRSSGVIAGDPTVSGIFTFTVQVTDSSTAPGGPDSAQAQLSLTVVTVVIISTTDLPAGSEGIAYLTDIDASGGTPPYTWTLAMGSLPPGLAMQPSSGVISGSPTSQGTFTFTVTAQDSSPTPQTQSQSLAITIGAPGPLAITTSSLLDGTPATAYKAKLVAIGGSPPYAWSISAGALPRGMSLNSSTGAISGTPSSTGTVSFTAVVTDSSSPLETQTQELSIAVNNAAEACTSSGNNAVLSGQYAFRLSGFNDAGFLTMVGSFTADGTGKITAGEADTNGVLGAQQGNIITAASSYSVGSDNRGCATLATPFGAFVTNFALGSISSNSAAAGRMIEWDAPSASAYIATGQLLRQTSSAFAAGLSGSYVFRTVGWDPSALGGRDVCVGELSAGGSTFTGLEQDCNDAWTITNTAAPAVAGTYSTLDANGRGTGIIALGETNSDITFYQVSNSQLLVVNADFGPFASGEWDGQSIPAGASGLTPAALDGNLVFYLSGLSLAGTGSAVSMETASADGTNSIAITYYEDRGGMMQSSNTYTCNYAVEPNGRVTLSSSTQSCGGTPPVLYLIGLNTGFIVDASPGVDTGSFEPQSAGPFSNASLSGSFFGGLAEVAIQSAQAEVDVVAPDGSGSIAGTTETSSTSVQDAGSSFLAATYTVNPDGTFSNSSSDGAVAGIIISSTKFVMFSPSTLTTPLPTLLVMQK